MKFNTNNIKDIRNRLISKNDYNLMYFFQNNYKVQSYK